MTQQHPRIRAIEPYLGELEHAAKQCVGVLPGQILRDAEEHLLLDSEHLSRAEPGLDDSALLQHFKSTYGDPRDVALAYEQDSGTAPSVVPATAPGWRIHCRTCGRSAPAARVGITRIGAHSRGKRVFGWCRGCGRLRWLSLTRDLEHEGTIQPDEGTGPGSRHTSGSNPVRLWSSGWIVLACLAMLAALPAVSGILRSLTSGLMAANENRSRAPGFESIPDRWSIVRETEVRASQLSQFSAKLNVPLTALFNTVVMSENQQLQINTLTTATKVEATGLTKALRSGKTNPRWVVQNENRVYEFVVRDAGQARVAAAARYAFPLQASRVTYQASFEVIPIRHETPGGQPDDRNRLYNLLLSPQTFPDTESEIVRLSRQFEFADEIALVSQLQQGIAAHWTSTAGAFLQPSDHAETVLLKCVDSDRILGMPKIRLSVEVTCDMKQRRAAGAEVSPALLSVTPHFPVNAAEIRDVVNTFLPPGASEEVRLRQLLNWFSEAGNIRYDGATGSRYGVLKVLQQRYGRCWDYSDLFITMARSAGLPCRQVYGWLHELEGHVWCDVLTNGCWQMVDPTTGTVCGSDYIPFCISESGEFALLYASPVSIVVKP